MKNKLKNYMVLWGTQCLSMLGSAMSSYALLLWVYAREERTLPIALLAVCTYLPSILFSFIAGTFADRHNKKTIMLVCDGIAAIATCSVCMLMWTGKLEVWHIYFINVVLSMANTFQTPADTVVVSAMVPKEYYFKISGLQSVSSSCIGILAPALATAVVSFTKMEVVFVIDLASFVIAASFLLWKIKIPEGILQEKKQNKNSYLEDCRAGFQFLAKNKPILRLIIYFTMINLFAYIGGGGITTTVTAMVLSRVENGKAVLGAVTASVGCGTLLGGMIVMVMRPPKNRVTSIFFSCGISFLLCDWAMAFFQSPWIWIVGNFIGNLPLSLMNANQIYIMRTAVPIELQGRVFAARDTLQYVTIPVSYLLGGVLADCVFEPMMKQHSSLQQLFEKVVGSGSGSGIAVMFLFTGAAGIVISAVGIRDRGMQRLNQL